MGAGLTELLNLHATARTEYGGSPHVTWECEDGWVVGYSTGRIHDSHEHDGKFAAVAWKPNSKKDATMWHIAYFRAFTKRKDAKARALALYRKHSPRWAARHPA